MNTRDEQGRDPNGVVQATSTVLALDGWGPVVADPVGNGTHVGRADPSDDQALAAQSVWRDRARFRVRTLPSALPPLAIDGQMIRILASAVAMTVAVLVATGVGKTLRARVVREPEPAPLAGLARLRRNVALTIDPSLTPVPTPQHRTAQMLRMWGQLRRTAGWRSVEGEGAGTPLPTS